MAGYCTIALELRSRANVSFELRCLLCLFTRNNYLFVNKRAIAFRLYSVSLTSMSCLSESKQVIDSYKKTWNPKFFMQ